MTDMCGEWIVGARWRQVFLWVRVGIQAREGDVPKKSSSCGESRRPGCLQEGDCPWGGEKGQNARLPAEGRMGWCANEALPGPCHPQYSLLLSQTTQLADLQTQDTAGATAGLMVRTPGPPFRASQPSLRPHPLTLPSLLQPGLQRLRRRDTHFPICIFCCGCCYPSKCGICCKT